MVDELVIEAVYKNVCHELRGEDRYWIARIQTDRSGVVGIVFRRGSEYLPVVQYLDWSDFVKLGC